ncbi:MAG: DUF4350 domain-containing protein [Thermoanaerobaculia bacterium]
MDIPEEEMKGLRSTHLIAATIVSLALAGCSSAIQQADLSFEPAIPLPAYPESQGPVVQIDEAHFNFHTVDGRYAPFAKLLRRDGYVVQGLAEPATIDLLEKGRIYVVANAIAGSDHSHWRLPVEPAFTRPEIEAIRDWVEEGGSLFLIADHMPFPGSVEDLAAEFDVLFGNGFLYDAEGNSKLDFTRDAGLAAHPITEGRDTSERVDFVRTFTGQAFRVERNVEPLLTLPPGSTLRLPVKAWKFKSTTPSIPAAGMLQGAVFRFGKGRVAVFGEAAMFSAQERIGKSDHTLMGMNHPDAAQNPQFLLNVVHWLSGLIE